jgi:hypothetical protein
MHSCYCANIILGDLTVKVVDDFGGAFSAKDRSGVVLLLIGLSLLLPHIPILNALVSPIQTFVTTVHELSHALACLVTGGHVGAMTIVNDGDGHGGLTFCRDGIPFIYTQAGYIGTALFGCLLIWFGQYPRLSKVMLFLMGATFGLASLTFMFGTVLHGGMEQGALSMLVGLFMAGAFIFASLRASAYVANLLLLFLGVQTGMNAIQSITWLFNPAGSSDADSMAQLTHIPAGFWSVFWLLFAVCSLGTTLWFTFKANKKHGLNTF